MCLGRIRVYSNICIIIILICDKTKMRQIFVSPKRERQKETIQEIVEYNGYSLNIMNNIIRRKIFKLRMKNKFKKFYSFTPNHYTWRTFRQRSFRPFKNSSILRYFLYLCPINILLISLKNLIHKRINIFIIYIKTFFIAAEFLLIFLKFRPNFCLPNLLIKFSYIIVFKLVLMKFSG